ncbi:MAG: AMP-dependent synthetase [Deltaproteobacteria bacterium]|nr:AMP-dependent synthetase [Deltaproteobacteria bacterium]
MSHPLGDAATLERIARARHSEKTAPALDALAWHEFRSLLEARSAEGERPFLVFRGGDADRVSWSYARFAAAVEALARRLVHELGVARGDRVALLMHNDPQVPISCFACWRIGACVVPVNLGEDDDRIRFVLENARCEVALALPQHESRARELQGALPVLRPVVVGDDDEATGKPSDLPSPEPEDEALIVYTSGTTGAPKGVVLTQRNLLVDADALRGWNDIDPDTRLMCVLPTHHVNGLIVTLVTPFLAGASTVLARRFQTTRFWQWMAEEKVQIVSVVPTLLAFLLEDGDSHEELDLSGFRHLICGAGPLTVELAARFEGRFGFRILHGYGLSETTCYSCMLPVGLSAEAHRRWMEAEGFPSVGVPLPPNEMTIHDPGGQALPEGERGEIVVRGVNVMLGYFGRPEANAETFAHGWFRSGDEGFFRRDAEGRHFFFITGRLKELIIRGGVNLSPFEIDEVLNRIPGVARGLAVGFENRWYGEEVGAYVMREEGSSIDEAGILAACRSELSYTKSPKVVVFGDDIPVTSTGKYQRGRLRPLFEPWRDEQFRA